MSVGFNLPVPSPNIGIGGSVETDVEEFVPTDELLSARLVAMYDRAARAAKLVSNFIVDEADWQLKALIHTLLSLENTSRYKYIHIFIVIVLLDPL